MDALHVAVAPAGVALLFLLAGCLSGAGGGAISTPTQAAPTTTPPPTRPSSLSTPGCAEWVSFYGLGGPSETPWAPDRVAIGYTVSANASVFFVAFEGDAVLGTIHVTTEDLDYGVTADGDRIPLGRRLEGEHTIRVVAYSDTNGNGRFDRGADAPCRRDGEVARAGPRTIDFDVFESRSGSTATVETGP